MSKFFFGKRCHLCSDLGAQLCCIQCNRAYHRDCSRQSKRRPDDEFVCDDCKNDDDDDDYCSTGRRVTPRRTARPPRKPSSASTQRRIGEFRQVSILGASAIEVPASSSSAPAGPEQALPTETASDEVNPVSEECIAIGAEGMSNDFCSVCQSGGRLLLCEHCPRAFHVTCIERLVDFDSFENSSGEKWQCPVCRHGVDVLRGKPRPVMAAADMETRMQNALRLNKRQRNYSVRRRDAFLSKRMSDIEPFASRPALSRIRKYSDQASQSVEIGSAARVVCPGGSSREVIVLAQTSQSRFRVADVHTQEEDEIERVDMLLLDDSSALHENPPDYLSYARKAVLSDATKLKDYQRIGVNWLIHAYYNRCGGILADDMGLGKTLQTLTLLSYLNSSGIAGPFLVVCPLSCAGNWAREAKRFVPHLSVAKIFGFTQERNHSLDDDEIWFGMKNIIITTYETIVAVEHYFSRHCWSVLVLDEAHRIKNQASRLRESIDKMECSSRVLLSGTPLQNNLQELFALLKFLWPDVLASDSELFNNAILLPEICQLAAASKSESTSLQSAQIKEESSAKDVQINTLLVDKIRNVLSILMLRRTKEQAIRLPPKIFHDIWLPLAPSQVSWYRSVLSVRHNASIAGRGLRVLLKLVVRLRQICAHPRCMAATSTDKEFLLQHLPNMSETEVNKLHSDLSMSEEVIAQSGKLVFLDKLLQQLHVQNMAFSDAWRKAFEERQVKAAEVTRKQGASAWLKSSEGILFLDDMQPWRESRESAHGQDGHAKLLSLDTDAVQTPRPHKVLIFCQYLASLDLLEAYCNFRKWRSMRLDGGTSRVLRELDMRDFNSDDEDHFIYLIGTRAGGLGINLATANHVVLFEQDWNPHVDSQAIDRAHRIGQNRKVNVYRMFHEWGIEERMFHRATSKLKMEKCVMSAGHAEDGGAADGEALLEKRQILSAEEIMMLLQHGEGAFKQFHGESVAACSLQHLLTRQHQPCPFSTKDESMPFQTSSDIKEEFVRDDGEGGSHVNISGAAGDVLPNEDGKQEGVTSQEQASSTSASQTPPPPSKPQELRRRQSIEEGADEDGEVKRTASGRIIRAPKQYVVEWPLETKVLRPREVIRHFSSCFICAEGGQCKPTRKGRVPKGGKADEGSDMPDLLCSICPRAYHKNCLPANCQHTKKRWSCPWHQCGQCGRGASAVGGMLIHCLQCPSALCYDCFPPNFRRVYASDKHFADLSSRGWNISPQTIVFFKCNSCRTLEEQKKRQAMRAEELEAQQDEKKKTALEEKRNLAATKKLLEHERQPLSRELHSVKERVLNAAEKLWPPRFRSSWLAKCDSTQGADELIKCASSKKTGTPSVDRLKLSLELCSNCNFPAHKVRWCPMPAEKQIDTHRNALCPVCDKRGHTRINCPKLNEEQRAEYERRCADLRTLADAFDRADPVAEPTYNETTPKAMVEAHRNVRVQVKEQISAVLRDLGFDMFIVAEPIAEQAKAEAERRKQRNAKAAEEKSKLAAEKAAAKSAAKAKARGKAKAKTKPVASSRIMVSLRKGNTKYNEQTAKGPDVSSKGKRGKLIRIVGKRISKSYIKDLAASQEGSRQSQHKKIDSVYSEAVSPKKVSKPKAKCKGAANAKAKSKASSSWHTIAPQTVLLREGPAKGWFLKGKAFSNGIRITVKKPGSAIWETKFQALKDHFQDRTLIDAIESERSILAKRMGEARAQEEERHAGDAPVENDVIDVGGHVIDVAIASQSDGESARDRPAAPRGSGIKRRRLHIFSTGGEAAADFELDAKHASNAIDSITLGLSDGPSPSGLSQRNKQGQDIAAQAENRFLIESISSRGRKRFLTHNFAGKGRGTVRAKVKSAPPLESLRLIQDDTDAGSRQADAQDID